MEPITRDIAASGLRERTPLDADDVRSVVEAGPVDQRRADTVDIDRNPELFEAADLLGVESARNDDPNVSIAVAVERFAKQLDESRRDSAKLTRRHAFFLLELAQDRAVDQGLARVDPHAPEARAKRVCDAERCIHDIVV